MAKKKDSPEKNPALYWHSAIEDAQESFRKWEERAKKVVDRYRDERGTLDNQKRRFNILWSNVQVLKPALYGRQPKPEVSRRYNDQDPVGRTTALIIERALEFEVEQYADFGMAMSGAVEDRLLPGRGVCWQRYEMGETGQEDTGQVSEDLSNRLAYECAPCDYVNWQDFLHNPARTWDEVWWVGRRVWMTEDEGVTRFGDIFKDVPKQGKPKDTIDHETPKDALKKKAQVWEIWDKVDRQVVWIATGYDQVLDIRADPLGLEKFFPCPRPLYATTTTGSLIPVPDYCEYQDQAEELDSITQRIHLLTRALKAVGVYNAEFKALKRIFNEGLDNDMLPVDSWAAFAEKGGLKGAVDFVPIDTVVKVLQGLVEMREQTKQVIYETMGISDIIRGSTKSDETLGAQQLKANFGSLRLRSSQRDVAVFATEVLRNKAQVMAKFFSPETLIKMSGIEHTADAQYLQPALALLKSGELRDFRISIEADTLAQIDEAQEKEQAMMFVKSVGEVMGNSLPMLQAFPMLYPIVSETISFTARKFQAGKTLENALDKSLQAMGAEIAKPKPPDPKLIAEQAKAKTADIQGRVALQKGQLELVKGQQEMAQSAQEGQIAREQAQVDLLKARTESQVIPIVAAADIAVAQMELATTPIKAEAEIRKADASVEVAEANAKKAKQPDAKK